MGRRKRVSPDIVLKELKSCGYPINLKELADRIGVHRRYVLDYVTELINDGKVTKSYDFNDMRCILYSPA